MAPNNFTDRIQKGFGWFIFDNKSQKKMKVIVYDKKYFFLKIKFLNCNTNYKKVFSQAVKLFECVIN